MVWSYAHALPYYPVESTMARNKVLLFSLALATCLFLSGNCREVRRPIRSVKAPAETIEDYEVVSPQVTHRSSQEAHPSELHVLVHSDNGLVYTLLLERNEYVLSPRFTSRHFDSDGKEVVTKGHESCFYHGKVLENSSWSVVMSTCRGLRGSFGDITDREHYYHLEPLQNEDVSLDQRHALYLDTELRQQNGRCGTGHHDDSFSPTQFRDDGETSDRVRRQAAGGFRIVEWTVVNDNLQHEIFGRNISETVLRSLDIANYVDNLYRDLGIRVELVDVITWTNGDEIAPSSDPDTLLNAFQDIYLTGLEVRQGLSDSTMLMTAIDLDSNTIGYASVRTMCRGTFSSGLCQDGGRSLDAIGATAAHELGHIFNMEHDDATSCNCPDGLGKCIMSAVSGFPQPISWSQCSRNDLNDGFNIYGLGTCLDNEPILTVGDPSCGNGIREGDEMCDCGSLQECEDPCCNATTCLLVDGAQCFSGSCCDSCRFIPYGTTCRESANECDIAEYCSGDSSDCPTDLHLQDSTPCGFGEYFCYEGFCPTYEGQCEFHFGSTSEVAAEVCFSSLNVAGDREGNCGYTGSNYIPCAESDVLCGQLQCSGGSFIDNFNVRPIISTVNVDSEFCRSFTTRPGSDFQSPGLVLTGTKCGNTSLCSMQQCVEISSLSYIQACPVGSNGETCSSNGQCNNLNQCSCNVGFNGETCAASGPGGGGGGSSNAGAIVGGIFGAILGVLLVVGVAVLVVFLVLRRRRKSAKAYSAPRTPRTAAVKPVSRPAPRGPQRKTPQAPTGGSQENLLDGEVQVRPSPTPVVRYNAYKPPTVKTAAAETSRTPPPAPPTGQRHGASAPGKGPARPPPTRPSAPPLARPSAPPPARPSAPPPSRPVKPDKPVPPKPRFKPPPPAASKPQPPPKAGSAKLPQWPPKPSN